MTATCTFAGRRRGMGIPDKLGVLKETGELMDRDNGVPVSIRSILPMVSITMT